MKLTNMTRQELLEYTKWLSNQDLTKHAITLVDEYETFVSNNSSGSDDDEGYVYCPNCGRVKEDG